MEPSEKRLHEPRPLSGPFVQFAEDSGPGGRDLQLMRNSNRAPKQKSPPRRVPGGRKGGRPMLLDAVSTLASLGLEGLHGVPGLFHRASHEPAHRVLLPSHALHDLREGGAVLALQHGDHLGRLAARARLRASRAPGQTSWPWALSWRWGPAWLPYPWRARPGPPVRHAWPGVRLWAGRVVPAAPARPVPECAPSCGWGRPCGP